MSRQVTKQGRLLGCIRRLTTVCKGCGARRVLLRPELAGISRAEVRTVDQLREALVCRYCAYANENPHNLRFHVEWIDEPANVVRLVPPSTRDAA